MPSEVPPEVGVRDASESPLSRVECWHELFSPEVSMHRPALVLLAVLLAGAGSSVAETRPFSVHDLVSMDRLSDPQVSPSGDEIVFVRRVTDLEADRGARTCGRSMSTAAISASSPRTKPATRIHAGRPTAPPIYFLSTRSGSSQVWQLPVAGGEAKQVTAPTARRGQPRGLSDR